MIGNKKGNGSHDPVTRQHTNIMVCKIIYQQHVDCKNKKKIPPNQLIYLTTNTKHTGIIFYTVFIDIYQEIIYDSI